MNRKRVISASRRTDIPGGYASWFMECIHKGSFKVINPFNRISKTIAAGPDDVHSIVFWSKNYGPFIDIDAHNRLGDKGYHLYFNFTVNADHSILEPGIPNLGQRLGQARTLVETFSPDQMAWRFDPICFYTEDGQPGNNLKGFAAIADHMADMGVTRCITSFYDPYKKVDRRTSQLARHGGPRFKLLQPNPATRMRVIEKMARYLASKGMGLYLCCEADLMAQMAGMENIAANACIDGRRLQRLFGGNPELSADYGQRRKQGCHCTKSVDIGSYDLHPCPHNCLFCYARTDFDQPQK